MTTKKNDRNAVSKEEINQQVGAAVRRVFTRMGFDPEPHEVANFLAENEKLPPNEQMPKAVEMALRFAFGLFAKHESAGIKTREDLDKVLQTLGEASEQAPTISRNVLDQVKKNLPRRGGPGRTPKLTFEESVKLCDEIAAYDRRHKVGTKKAIAEISLRCPELIHKKVGARTLEKVWAKRDEFINSGS